MKHLNQTAPALSSAPGPKRLWIATLCVLSLLGSAALPSRAQVVVAPTTPKIGSSNPVSAEPTVARPATTPCSVTLFSEAEFNQYAQKPFNYAPPSCKGPWAKIVLTGDFTVTAGVQYDRTAEIYIGGANVFFGTTAEPRSALSPSWHVERDITDLSALLATAQTGTAIIYNIVNSTYTGIIYGTVKLEFYPAGPKALAAKVPDEVVPLSANGQDQYLNTTASQLTQTLSLPKNIEEAYLDVIAQSQSNDEFWYTCAPNDVAAELANCGSTGFREVEVSIDGTPAGLAPVYPWIYTGGLDPYLWEPNVGVQTLNFKPFRVNLTPFAALLSNGQKHTVAVSVFNADSYFDVTAAVLLYLDHGTNQITGAVTKNTLTSTPDQQILENLSTDASGNVTGNVTVYSLRSFSLDGYVNTSHGKVETTVDETADFGNYQTYDITSLVYDQQVSQISGASSVTHTKEGALDLEEDEQFYYPLTVNYDEIENNDGSYKIVTSISQEDSTSDVQKLLGYTLETATTDEKVNTGDTWNLSPLFSTVSHSGSATSTYVGSDSLGDCYSRTLTSSNNKLTGVTDGASCGGKNTQ